MIVNIKHGRKFEFLYICIFRIGFWGKRIRKRERGGRGDGRRKRKSRKCRENCHTKDGYLRNRMIERWYSVQCIVEWWSVGNRCYWSNEIWLYKAVNRIEECSPRWFDLDRRDELDHRKSMGWTKMMLQIQILLFFYILP